jgi:serine protease Do
MLKKIGFGFLANFLVAVLGLPLDVLAEVPAVVVSVKTTDLNGASDKSLTPTQAADLLSAGKSLTPNQAADLLNSGKYILIENLPDMVERVVDAVINISSTSILSYEVYGFDLGGFYGIPQERRQTSLGSGVIIDDQGYAVTNAHVIQNASEVMVTFNDKRQFPAKVIGKDEKMDVAVLQIRTKAGGVPEKLKCVGLGDSEQVRVAQTVVAVGNPFGLQHTVTRGIISGKNRTIGLGPLDNFLQTDASINPGNSGGPLFDTSGLVIGINTAIRSDVGQSAGVGFAIPSGEAQAIIPDLKRYGYVPRPWLGILSQPMSQPLAAYVGIGFQAGVLVGYVVEGSPAFNRGIRQADVIVKVGDVDVKEPGDIERAFKKLKPKDTVTLRILRAGKTQNIEVVLDVAPRNLTNKEVI